MLDLIGRGGPVMLPILVAFLSGVVVFLMRLWSLRRTRVAPSLVVGRVRDWIEAGQPLVAADQCATGSSSLERILAVGLCHAGQSRASIKERMEEVGRREHARLARYVGLVGVVATIEPLLGLLGTVTGMIDVFQGVVGGGVGDPKALANGIWSALITTAAGLSTGIPAYLAFRYLNAQVDDRMLELEMSALDVLERIAAREGHLLTRSGV